jgi:3-oxoacyl-[acyl-carrier protein] reductase
MNYDFSGKAVLITGASRGLGLELAREFRLHGADLALLSRNKGELEKVRASLPEKKDSRQKTAIYAGDLRALAGVPQIIDDIYREMGRLDILINNAGVLGPVGPAWENQWSDWESTMAVNFLAPVRLCGAAVRYMKENKYGKIINISGGGATGPRPGFSAYGSAKAALVRFSETLAVEVKGLGICVNCVAPGMMNTRMLEQVVAAGPEAAGEKEYRRALDGISGEYTTDRAVRLVMFLASPDSDGITGKIISAVWDPWEKLPGFRRELEAGDVYTLRRIVPRDRGFEWGEIS